MAWFTVKDTENEEKGNCASALFERCIEAERSYDLNVSNQGYFKRIKNAA
jgi:hypothetical protein